LFGVIVLAQYALFETGMRIKGGSEAAPTFQQLFMRDPDVGHRPRPGARIHYKTSEFETDIAINSAGVRGEEFGPKAPNERRIVVLGDSLVLSVQVQLRETFCAKLEARLNEQPPEPGARYRVINAGVQGYGPVEEWAFFDHVVRRLEPDLVLIATYVGNDAMEANDSGEVIMAPPKAAADQVKQHEAAAPRRESPFPNWMRRIVRRSMVLQTIRLRGIDLIDRFGKPHPVERALTMSLPTLPADMAHGLVVTRECIKRISESASAQGARTAIVLMPARFQVADYDFELLKPIVALTGEDLQRNLGTARFKEALAPLGLPTLDALPLLHGSRFHEEIFFKSTAHLTIVGHDVLADGLDRFVRESKVLAPAGTGVEKY
jgi:hypothetical protein